MAEVAATVANGGKLMEPTFLHEAKDPDGRVLEELGDGDEQSQVISEESAPQLNEMMTNVTREGTAAALDVAGVEFAGKTGTAELDVEASLNQPWFIGFAPARGPAGGGRGDDRALHRLLRRRGRRPDRDRPDGGGARRPR